MQSTVLLSPPFYKLVQFTQLSLYYKKPVVMMPSCQRWITRRLQCVADVHGGRGCVHSEAHMGGWGDLTLRLCGHWQGLDQKVHWRSPSGHRPSGAQLRDLGESSVAQAGAWHCVPVGVSRSGSWAISRCAWVGGAACTARCMQVSGDLTLGLTVLAGFDTASPGVPSQTLIGGREGAGYQHPGLSK